MLTGALLRLYHAMDGALSWPHIADGASAHGEYRYMEIRVRRSCLAFNYCQILTLAIFLSSCHSVEPQEKNKVDITLVADKKVNPNEKGQPSPVGIRIYELTGTDAFAMSDYFTITDGSDPELLTQIKKVSDVMIKPGEKRELEITPAADAVALGIVAAYRDINHAQAVTAWPVNRNDERAWYSRWFTPPSPALQVDIGSLALSVKEVE
jgi:type VI secretion system protein VasD